MYPNSVLNLDNLKFFDSASYDMETEQLYQLQGLNLLLSAATSDRYHIRLNHF